jgi:amino acid transporter
MADRPVAQAIQGGGGGLTSIPERLEPNAIGVTQDTVIGMASSAPAGTLAATLAALAAAAAYGSGPVLILCAIPMVIIANCYRRLNLWSANAGASFEWVGRSINPYLGFLTGWLMVVGYIIGTVAEVVVLGPAVLAVFGSSSTSQWAQIGIDTGLCVAMLVVAVVGIKLTARTQITMAVIEYAIIIGFAVWGLVAVLGHHHGTYPITKGWFSVSGVGGKGSLAAALLIAVYDYSLWDGTLYVNEEVKHRRVNPGKAAVIAVGLLAVIYVLVQVGLQGVVSPARMQANSSTAMVYVASALGGAGWAKVMALAIALSVTAATGTGIVLTSRIVYGMASWRTLPPVLGNVSTRWRTPAVASCVVGLLIIAVIWVYILGTSTQSLLTNVVSLAGLLAAAFYILTAAATVVFYRRRIFSNLWDALMAGILPIAAAAFLVWIMFKSIQGETAGQKWAIVGILAVGIAVMAIVRVTLRPDFFKMPREAASKEHDPTRHSQGVLASIHR